MTGPAAFYRGTYLLAFRWTRLSEDAHANSSTAVIADGGTSWMPGQNLLLLSSSFNPWQV